MKHYIVGPDQQTILRYAYYNLKEGADWEPVDHDKHMEGSILEPDDVIHILFGAHATRALELMRALARGRDPK